MKKQIIFIMAFFACAINALAENLSIADVSLTQGEATSVNINLTNSATNIVGFQFDLTLPEAVAPVTSSTGAVNVTATSRLGGSFTLRGKSQGNNTYRFVYLSTSGTGISGISGSIFSINLSISETASCGIVEGAISNVTITGKDGSEISPEGSSFNITLPHTATAVAAKTATCTEDGNKAYWYCSACNKYFTTSACTIEATLEAMTIPAFGHSFVESDNGDGTHTIVCSHCEYRVTEEHEYVDGGCSKCGALEPVAEGDTDINQFDNVIYLNNIEGIVGTKLVIPISMKNNSAFTGLQFDITLPDGIVPEYTSDGDIDIVLAGDRKADHGISANIRTTTGALAVAIASMKNKVFTGEDGVIAYLTVNIDKDMQVGDYSLVMSNIEMARPDNTKENVDRFKATLTVADYIPGDVNNDKIISISDVVGIINIIIEANTSGLYVKAADVNSDGSVSITDAVCAINIIIGAQTNNSKSLVPCFWYNEPTLTFKSQYVIPGEEFVMPIVLNGTNNSISALQMDIDVPAGLELVDITSDCKHEILSAKTQNGKIRVVAISFENETYTGNGDKALELHFKSADDYVDGSVELSNVEMCTYSGVKANANAISAKVSANDVTGVGTIVDASNRNSVYDIHGYRVKSAQKGGVYIVNGKIVYKNSK